LSIGTKISVLMPPSSDSGNRQWVAVEVGLLRTEISDVDRLPGPDGAGNGESRAKTEHSSAPPRMPLATHRGAQRAGSRRTPRRDRVRLFSEAVTVLGGTVLTAMERSNLSSWRLMRCTVPTPT